MIRKNLKRRFREDEEQILSKEEVIKTLNYYQSLGEGSIFVPISGVSGNSMMEMQLGKVIFRGNMCFLKGTSHQISFSWQDVYFIKGALEFLTADGSSLDMSITAYSIKTNKRIFDINVR